MTLRLRPDRILIGEVRGPEALALLKAWNTGHPGGLATLHANSAADALRRLEDLIGERRAIDGSTNQPYGLCEFGHQGLMLDEELGNGEIYYNRARMYHAGQGRMMQRDPIGYVDGMSLYQYVRSNPISLTDPSGLKLIRTEPPQRLTIPFSKGEMTGMMFRSLHCCPSGTKNAGQMRWVTEINVSGSYEDKIEKTLADLPNVMGMVGKGLELTDILKAATGIKWTIAGTLSGRYDGCVEKILKSAGSIVPQASVYGQIHYKGKLPFYDGGGPNDLPPDFIGAVGTGNMEMKDVDLYAEAKGGISATGTVRRDGNKLSLFGGASVNGAIEIRAVINGVTSPIPPAAIEYIILKDQEWATYTFPND
jgi:RHS repeat-associated protein